MIFAAKEGDPDADVSALEAEIDQLIYSFYGLRCSVGKGAEGRA